MKINDYKSKLTKKQKERAIVHLEKYSYNIEPTICAWYDDLKDFYSDWCDGLGYSKDRADDLLNGDYGNEGEFLIFDNGEIVRFVH